MTTIHAPFSPAQVEALNRFQKDGRYHPFTCPGEDAECRMDQRELIATPAGWICVCGAYKQSWAHSWMAGHPDNYPGLS